MTVDQIIDRILKVEGGYINHPNDKGGETNHGITVAVARANGYKGPMRNMTQAQAREIYRVRYVIAPGFGLINNESPTIAAELVDTGVNMGPSVPSGYLQRALNALNRQQQDYKDIVADRKVGPATVAALKAYLGKRGADGERRLLALLNALQGARYLSIAENNPTQEAFMFGWLDRIVS